MYLFLPLVGVEGARYTRGVEPLPFRILHTESSALMGDSKVDEKCTRYVKKFMEIKNL